MADVRTASVLGSAVRERRRQLGLRQDEVADLAGVSERFVFAVETGKETLRLDKVLALLGALGLHLELHRGAADGLRLAPGLEPDR